MNRRGFLLSAMLATAAGILVPEWILDPPKGRSMVSVPSLGGITDVNFAMYPLMGRGPMSEISLIISPRLAMKLSRGATVPFYWHSGAA